MQSSSIRRMAAFVSGPLSFIILLLWNPFDLEHAACITLAVAAWMITWWILEALPMPVVALMPLVLFPILHIGTIKDTAASYGDSIIFLFLGGFLIGLAIEKWDLHKRIALSIVKVTGTSGDRIVLGFILSTGFLSMWLSNTATTMMMYPIALSVIQVVSDNRKGHGNAANFSFAIMLSIAYASNFGGIATLIGTPPNVAFAAFMQEKYHYTIGFVEWLMVCLPVSVLLLISLYIVLTKWLHPNGMKKDAATGLLIGDELRALGPISKAEKRVLIVFVGTALLWITKDLINATGIIRLDDTIIAIAGASFLFMIPSGSREEGRRKLLEWPDTSKMAWGILLLFGGGIALAAALEKAGLIQKMGTWIAGFAGSNILLLVVAIALLSIFISEVMSNIAQVIVFAPVIGGMADALKINPLLLGIPMTLAASCASMLPMGTPPNAIVFASGHVPIKKMVLVGLVMNLISVILISLFSWWGLNK